MQMERIMVGGKASCKTVLQMEVLERTFCKPSSWLGRL